MRILALDLGEKHIGVAVSDESARIAFPLIVLKKEKNLLQQLKKIVKDYEVETILVGHPLNLQGKEGSEGRKNRLEAERLTANLNVNCVLWDERYTTQQAQQFLTDDLIGGKRKQKKEKEHMVASAILLQSYLDYLHNKVHGA